MPLHSQTHLQQVSAGQPEEQEAEGTTAGAVAQGDNWVPPNLSDGHPARVERSAVHGGSEMGSCCSERRHTYAGWFTGNWSKTSPNGK